MDNWKIERNVFEDFKWQVELAWATHEYFPKNRFVSGGLSAGDYRQSKFEKWRRTSFSLKELFFGLNPLGFTPLVWRVLCIS